MFQFDFHVFEPRREPTYRELRGQPFHSPCDSESDSGAEGSTAGPNPDTRDAPEIEDTQETSASSSVSLPASPWPGKVRELDYQITDSADPKYVDLVVPYLTYSQFQTTAVYKTGISYHSFIDMLRSYTVGYSDVLTRKAAVMCDRMAMSDARQSRIVAIDEDHEASSEDAESDYLPSDSEISSDNLCNGMELVKTTFPVWLPGDGSSQETQIRQGLLNGIPGDSAVMHDGKDMPFNLVSSKWLEWRDFAVYPAVNDPDIKTLEGDAIKCHGYIMGTWTDAGVLETRWSGLCFHVVDCVFGEEGLDGTHNFLISRNLLSDENSVTCKSAQLPRPLFPDGPPEADLTRHSVRMGQEAALRAAEFLLVPICAMSNHDYGEPVEAAEEEE